MELVGRRREKYLKIYGYRLMIQKINGEIKMNRMRKLLCPQCKISGMYVKNATGERLLVYVSDKGEVIPKYEDVSTEGFDMNEVFCLGCSWSGDPRKLVKR